MVRPRAIVDGRRSDLLSQGNLVHVRAFNQHLIILNGIKEATDLLHGRGATYSDRVQKTMMHEL